MVVLEMIDDRPLQFTHFRVRHIHAGEEIRNDGQEERTILGEKLGHIRVAQRTNQHHVFRKIIVAALQRASHDEHTLQRAKTKVVVVLLRELLRG